MYKRMMVLLIVVSFLIFPFTTSASADMPATSIFRAPYEEPMSEEDWETLNAAELYRDNVLFWENMPAEPESQIYDVWMEPNLHLMMSDNGTPGIYDDDWVVDWEDNRKTEIFIND